MAVARELRLSKGTIAYHARAIGVPVDERCNRRYDWAEIQRYYDDGHSITMCQKRFGFARQTWNDARKRGDVLARPQGMPVEALLTGYRGRDHLKQRLYRLGLKEPCCEICGLETWRERQLSLCLHHINGDGGDNRLENLQLLCPNCHSQTGNFAGRNRGRSRTD